MFPLMRIKNVNNKDFLFVDETKKKKTYISKFICVIIKM